MNPNLNSQQRVSSGHPFNNSNVNNIQNSQNNFKSQTVYGPQINTNHDYNNIEQNFNNTNNIHVNLQTQIGMTQNPSQYPNEDLSFSQMVKNNLENSLLQIPEKFSSLIRNKIQNNFQLQKESLDDLLQVTKQTESTLQAKIEKIKSKVKNVEDQIDTLITKSDQLMRNSETYQNLLGSYLYNPENVAERIFMEREKEQIINNITDEVEIIKCQVQENITNIEEDIMTNIHLEENSLQGVKNLIIDKLEEINKEIKNVEINKEGQMKSKCKDFRNLSSNSNIDLNASVRKLKEVKTHLENMKKNRYGSFITKQGFSLKGKQRVSINSNVSEVNNSNWLESYANANPVVRKKKNDEYNFFSF